MRTQQHLVHVLDSCCVLAAMFTRGSPTFFFISFGIKSSLKGYLVHDLVRTQTRWVFLCCLMLGRGVIYLECKCCVPCHLRPQSPSSPVTFIPRHLRLLSPSSPVTYIPCHLRPQSPSSPVTFVPCHLRPLSPSSPVTFILCHLHPLSPSSPVTLVSCHLRPLSPSSPVTFDPNHLHPQSPSSPATCCGSV
ncbi:hypothetical protein Pcinc_036600 [Petrolisthes cinctipes]|uniref:Uncharacterized protein n=1 Tax=Petrolisthes cinctipes TaxID=88211 RepID=A0AAE1BXD1_PETCI|nr:hypothetical protein Pcinc_036600 [Petrolisthes cinctipes]